MRVILCYMVRIISACKTSFLCHTRTTLDSVSSLLQLCSFNSRVGRPFALQGDYYANIFVHFKPMLYEPTEVQPHAVGIDGKSQGEL